MTRTAVALGALVLTALVIAVSAEASCIFQTPAQQRSNAKVIFDGVVLDNPTATGVQRFKVTRYLKGRGPAIVRVQTGNGVFVGGGGATTSVSIVVRKGQRWRIFSRGSAWKILPTSVCDGSRRL